MLLSLGQLPCFMSSAGTCTAPAAATALPSTAAIGPSSLVRLTTGPRPKLMMRGAQSGEKMSSHSHCRLMKPVA